MLKKAEAPPQEQASYANRDSHITQTDMQLTNHCSHCEKFQQRLTVLTSG
jgi:hypothetical protein